MIKPENGLWSLYGHVTLFGESTHIFKIADLGIPINSYHDLNTGLNIIDLRNMPETNMAIFNNETRKIKVDRSYQIYRKM